ncbi:hypothetical protein ASG49_00875 [Marmoricola sp. Leaf446]|uniref:ABC transporter substrate-binding protein n=1 Tax=Marmoricola sp. Leaf446 TaxID=1736379 RepID=UPI0006FAB54D|nr:glycine betaine ABC transporter substrate-binding protein [Marmoricola sp. Leaf446]KQT93590.1 hypothetical protein ASG49_00875 [Marmoricola sp. Leaf446]
MPTPRRTVHHPARPVVLAVALLTVVLLAGCGGDTEAAAPAERRSVTLVAQSTTEGDVLTALYGLLLEQAGYRVEVAGPAPREDYLEALSEGRAQLAPDYVSALAETLRGEGTAGTAPGAGPAAAVPAPAPDVALDELEALAREVGLAPLQPARAEDVRSFAVTRAFAEEHRLRTLSDLARSGQRVALAADTECATRADCAPGLREIYGIRLRRTVPVGIDGGDTLGQLRGGAVQLAQVASTDGRLAAPGADVVVLADDRDLQPSQQVVPVANAAWVAEQPVVRTVMADLARVLTTGALRGLNAEVDGGEASAREAAQVWLGEQGLL